MWLKKDNPFVLVVGMVGVKLGDRLLQIGCGHGGRLGAVAAKVGLSGRAAVVAPDEASAERARKGAADAGVLVEIEVAPPTRLPSEDGSVDIAVVDDTSGVFGAQSAGDLATAVREVLRVLRPGGRVMIIGATPRAGLGGLLSRAPNGPPFAASGEAGKALEAGGFQRVRTLGEREGLVFVEGVKPRHG